MNELVKVQINENQEQVVSAREVYERLGIMGLIEGETFQPFRNTTRNHLRMSFKIHNFPFWYILPSIKEYIAKTPIHASIWRKFKYPLRKERTQNLSRHPSLKKI